jgi:putative Holliday junction resolvase
VGGIEEGMPIIETTITQSAPPKLSRAATRYTDRVTNRSSQEIPAGEAQRTRILGIDYGRSRIGLAIADAIAALPRPLDTLERINRNEDMRRLREIIRDHGVKQIVVGLPLLLDGSRGEMAEEAQRFAERVRKQFGLPVEMVDERLTSWEAERLIEEQSGRVMNLPLPSYVSPAHGRKTKKIDGARTVDAMAAAVILKEYLAMRPTAPESI